MKKSVYSGMAILVCVFCLINTAAVNAQSFSQLSEKKTNISSSYSSKTMGCSYENGLFTFRLFAPSAQSVSLQLYRSADKKAYRNYQLKAKNNGIWEISLKKYLWQKYYTYTIKQKNDLSSDFPSTAFADPYSKNVSTVNNYNIQARSYICRNNFHWSDTQWQTPRYSQDLIIYEAHVRDMTAHSSAGAEHPGTYLGFIEKIPYLRSIGVNAVEFLPLHDFANMEIPYKDSTTALFNTWNPYERNHWGYMTTFFFSPENYYSTVGQMDSNSIIDDRGKSQFEFKKLVNTLHMEGFSVLMDVVYNHTSTYDANPFKCIDKNYYYRMNADGSYKSVSGCGNDFKTESPMARKLIVESILYWMQEYHIDGFRFDLASMIDDETLSEIIKQARMINPNVAIIAEPWGGTYNPDHFSDLNWSSWNDQFRNGIKGQNPHSRKGFIFGNWDAGTSRQNVIRYLMGSLREDGGQYISSSHAVNYLEAHDDNTFGDFVRFALDLNTENEIISHPDHGILSGDEIKIHKLGAFVLASSQGMTMIHAGQEYGRSKVMEINSIPDDDQGKIDHNSYNKDNSTNYINYDLAKINQELIEFYHYILKIRKEYPELRHSDRQLLSPFYADSEFGIGYHIDADGDKREMLILINGSQEKPAYYQLPDGLWRSIASTDINRDEIAKKQFILAPSSGVILTK